MPYVLVFNRGAIDERIARLAGYIGLKSASFDGFLDWVIALRAELGVPHTLRHLGVDDRRFDEIARMATADPSAGSNPVPLDDRSHRQLLEASFAGRLS
jgi:alcohol dehydrogenase